MSEFLDTFMPPSFDALAWREGGRIRRADGSGYGDMVPDSDIIDHLIGHAQAGNRAEVEWCVEVLGIRHAERADMECVAQILRNMASEAQAMASQGAQRWLAESLRARANAVTVIHSERGW